MCLIFGKLQILVVINNTIACMLSIQCKDICKLDMFRFISLPNRTDGGLRLKQGRLAYLRARTFVC